MANKDTPPSLAVFCDYENVALGVKDAQHDAFSIGLVLERLLDKGNIIVKKAYADWERYRSAKRALHEAAFEMIEIPHTSYSGKNSADIRMCVDALDLCYTKDHLQVFVIVSGDSDFSPLVSKLRENAKTVIGIGVKNSSSNLLIENCDEFIFYDDLARMQRSAQKKKSNKRQKKASEANKAAAKVADKGAEKGGDKKPAKRPPAKNGEEKRPQPDKRAEKIEPPKPDAAEVEAEMAGDKEEALEMVLDTVEALFRERDENLWGSMVKQTLKRKKPHFSESYFGYRNFNQLLADAERRGLLELEKDQKSGGYLIIAFGPKA